MTTMDIGKEVAALCKQGKNQEAIDRFYSPNIESVEPVAMPGMGSDPNGHPDRQEEESMVGRQP